MERLVREITTYMPRIDFSPEGKLVMEGRAIPEDATKFFAPLIEFADNLNTNEVIFDINLEYFNTAASKKLLELMKHLDANNNITSVRINWHFEEGDEDSVDTAEIYEDSLVRVDFRYFEYAEVA
jgi:hypothetical protein